MEESKRLSPFVPIFVIVWDLFFEIPPSVVGIVHEATAPASFGFQTLAEIITSIALLYAMYGKSPANHARRDRIMSLISAISFLALALACVLYTVLYWNVRVEHDFQTLRGLTLSELVIPVVGPLGTWIGYRMEKRSLRKGYSPTLHAHSEQLWLCFASSIMVGLALVAAWLGWKDSWYVSPQSLVGLAVAWIAYKEGRHLLKEWLANKKLADPHSHIYS